MLIGITGSIGSGKSTVASLIRGMGHPVLDSDGIAREITETDTDVQEAIRMVFGASVFIDQSHLDRKKLAEIVFKDKQLLTKLNGIIHPKTVERITNTYRSFRRTGTSVVFVESALIFQANLESMFDFVIAVAASTDTVVRRLAEQRQAGEQEILARLGNQPKPETYKQKADFVIKNDGSLEELERNTMFVVKLIQTMKVRNET